MADISGENFVLISAILIFMSVLAGKVAYRYGAPALLLFLGVGILFGYKFIDFDSVELAQFVGMIALCIILFTGGMETKLSEIRPILSPGIVLATVGVLLTALIVAVFVYFITPWLGVAMSFPLALLLAATMSSTDSASVFSILRSKSCGLKQNLRPLLEMESGSNDPVAYMLTILLVGVVSHSDGAMSIGDGAFMFIIEMGVGLLVGYLIGRFTVWTINHINISNAALYPVLLLAFAFFAFSFASLLQGNGYLSVYIAGLIVGNHKLEHKQAMTNFFDGFTWLLQIVMFLTLGLLINLDELLRPEVLLLGGLVGTFLIFVARPAAVLLCLSPFRKFTTKARLYVSWVGLRGAVPIVFATYPMLAEVENANLLFNVVYLVTILSLVIQGTTVSSFANWLGLAYAEKASSFGEHKHTQMKSALTEVAVNEMMLERGCLLSNISLPENTVVMMVCRDGDYFVPTGKSSLLSGDKLLVISDRNEELQSTYKEMGIDDVMKLT